ncbi:hypothetical protein [Natrinema sp. SYSU A 869]|uniref:hypothetical protein n=1 Tax=Natrinema sp. SYSU A 869 TaxID=2871694 RepID=UPI001CA3A275|nr:hypothetical protein [Natrinema sp. SYSU A 869]
MNERRLRPVYLIGVGGCAYAFWYFISFGANLTAAAFGVATVALIVRLRMVTGDS